jgi:hypothetical protein
MSMINKLLAILFAVALTACGGGGGSPGTNVLTGAGGTTTSALGGGTSAASTTSSSSPTIALTIQDGSGSNVARISVAGSFGLVATVKDSAGKPVANRLVDFQLGTSAAGLAKLGSTTALSDAAGIARVTITPLTVASVGAGFVVASSVVDNVGVATSFDFGVAASNLTLAALAIQNVSLASGGNTSVQTTASVGGAPTSVPVNVVFTTSCGRINGASAAAGVSVTTNGSGVAQASYDATDSNGTLCSGAVSISASSAGATSVNGNVNVAAPTASTIAYLSSSPNKVFLAGSGAAERSEVSFKVFSSTGVALPNVSVDFSIVTNPGGVGIGASGSTNPITVLADASGVAKINVFSGSIPGPVKLRAALTNNAAVFSESQNLTVASGPASQRFMSLSVTTFNIEGWNFDGSSTRLTVRVADRRGNAVEDGTVVNFTAEGGQIASSCATTQNAGISSCSVDFISQNPRPAGGRVTVMAYLEGIKDFTDNNSNGRYDAGTDTLSVLGNAYQDDNENGVADPGEFIVPRGASGTCAGTGGAFPSQANSCDTGLGTTVRQQTVILFSSTEPIFSVINRDASEVRVAVRSRNNTLLPMPAGTTISAAHVGNSTTCTVSGQSGSPVPSIQSGFNPSADLASIFVARLKTCSAGDPIEITVTSPSGLATVATF